MLIGERRPVFPGPARKILMIVIVNMLLIALCDEFAGDPQ